MLLLIEVFSLKQSLAHGFLHKTSCTRAHFDESVLLFHTIIKRVLLNIEGSSRQTHKACQPSNTKLVCKQTSIRFTKLHVLQIATMLI